MEQACLDSLHQGKFPFVAEPERQRGRTGDGGKGGQIRAQEGIDWSFGGSTPSDKSNQESNVKGGRKVVIFVVGGITMSEMRCAYEVARQHEVDLYLGGSTILTPRSVIQQLKSVHQSRI
eukprot:GHVO01028394.1.p1 GENE.GHVO01028394.1~~GHVO01028394.1.p1  ORF type:complete len:137 (-),score=12.91 GHVO01028394.1:177-536(-)